MAKHHGTYYVPESSCIPIVTAFGLFCVGLGSLGLDNTISGPVFFLFGLIIMGIILFSWFYMVIQEDQAGLYDAQMERSFRWGVIWFLFTDFALFGILFFVLFYVRVFSVPDLGGEGIFSNSILTNLILWPNFTAEWPLLHTPDPASYHQALGAATADGLPTINTTLLFLSIIFTTAAIHAIARNHITSAIVNLVLILLLGMAFIFLQVFSMAFIMGSNELTLNSGVYASIFYSIVSVHLMHVMVAVLILLVILVRLWRGHFSLENHFGLQASLWFWNFICLMWLPIFLFLYWK